MNLFFLAELPQAIEGIQLQGNWTIILIGIALILLAVFIILHLKQIIVNSVLGAVVWAITVFVFHAQLPLIPSLVISIIFGLAGIGAMLVLKFFGLM